MAAKINDESQLQEEILNENFATIQECENRIIEKNRNLWERGYGQNDFLRVRLGYGEGNLNAEISYSDRHFSLDDDNLREELYSLCESDKTLHNIPITYSMFENYISGIIGQKKQVIEFAKGLIIQLAALYSYDEVKFVCIYDESEKEEFEFVKWIPHVWSDDKNFRFIARNANEVKEISAYFENIIEEREHINESEINAIKPYYIIFDISKNLGIRTEVIKKILIMEKRINISIVTFFEELKDLPKECSMIVSLDGNTGKLFDKNDISGNSISFVPDIYVTKDPLDMSVKLANTILDNTISNAKLPSVITFMQLFGVGKVEHLNVLTRWKENNPTKTLQTPVGIDIYGETFMLDLHEKFHGPHGLVAGMTGSGKSEFIITYILSLAVNYHPYEVAFILIDYKGGGMAKSFEHLPHTAGIITNLDGAAINRSLVSIQSELKRRQEIFAQTSKLVNVSNIDIYKYQKLYREGKVSEAKDRIQDKNNIEYNPLTIIHSNKESVEKTMDNKLIACLTNIKNGTRSFIEGDCYEIGTDIENDLCLTGKFISRNHAKIIVENGKYYLIDCNSKNGTFINSVRIPVGNPVEIFNNSEIYFADECFIFTVER